MKIRWLITAALCFSAPSAFGSLVFNITFDDSAMSTAGLTAGQIASVHTAVNFATSEFSNDFSDPIDINITVTAVAGTAIFGQSSTGLDSVSYSALRAALAADATTANDATALGAGGSVPSADPVSGSHGWWVSSAEAKALGLIPNNLTTDGTFTFGAGFNYTFDPANRAVAGEFDFIGIAEHEISEIMGRIPGLGTQFSPPTPGYMAYDLFRYTGSGVRGLTNGGGVSFSINNGVNLLMPYNNASVNGGDPQDWAGGTDDSFNAFSSGGVENGLSTVDLQALDVIGYDLTSPTPEPATFGLLGVGLLFLGLVKRSRNQRLPK
jgi:hypothetical protein